VIERIHHALLQVYRRLPLRGRRMVVRTIAPKYSVGAICLVERPDGRLLLVRQTYKDRWGVPGGLLQRGELPVVAGVREVMEEVGLPIEVVGEPAVVVEPGPQRIDVVYRARPVPGADVDDLRPRSVEIAEVAWFGQDDLPELQEETAQALVALARSSRSPQAPHLAPPGDRSRAGT
jgi:8-oxo-dGTP pyrophosphatase MutT (NUDIX family)